MQPTYSRSDTLTFFQLSVYPTFSSSDQQQLEAAEKPRAGRSEVSYGGCNTILLPDLLRVIVNEKALNREKNDI